MGPVPIVIAASMNCLVAMLFINLGPNTSAVSTTRRLPK
jgi:hypothetical protein